MTGGEHGGVGVNAGRGKAGAAVSGPTGDSPVGEFVSVAGSVGPNSNALEQLDVAERYVRRFNQSSHSNNENGRGTPWNCVMCELERPCLLNFFSLHSERHGQDARGTTTHRRQWIGVGATLKGRAVRT